MQKVLVTAGASGIGREMARAFAGAGAQVAVIDIDAAALSKLRSELPNVIAESCDLGELAQIESVVPRVIEALGGLDVLVNNAGIAGQTAPVEQVSPAEWDRVMRVNLGGTFNVTRLAIPHLKKSSAGSIINMSSAAGRLGYPQRSAYATSKWGIVGFTKTLSMELGAFGIRVNAICPGPVAGERIERVIASKAQMRGVAPDVVRDELLGHTSLRRLVSADDIANAIVFLASRSGANISGHALPVDGDTQALV